MKIGSELFADVILPLALPKLYTYSISEHFHFVVNPGFRVIVQFGSKRYYTALVFAVHKNAPDYKTKDIFSVLDISPTVNSFQLEFWKWMKDYYLCSYGEIFKAAIPSGLKLESETIIGYNPEATKNEELDINEKVFIEKLKEKGFVAIKDLENICQVRNPLFFVNKLIEKNLVFVSEKIREKYKAKTITYIALNDLAQIDSSFESICEKLENAPKQKELLSFLVEKIRQLPLENTRNGIPVENLKKQSFFSVSALNGLILKGFVCKNELVVDRNIRQNFGESCIKQLNDSQKIALEKINEEFEKNKVVLLHGVTSSGKTEIYIHLIKSMLDKAKQVLYLLPEIAITSQIINRLKEVFGDKVGVYHSKFSDSERVEIWNNVAGKGNSKKYDIILGVRSSIFLPFDNLGLIIVDEEHENTYKQQDPAPRYHARDSSIVLAKIFNAKILLGTATPSIETYYNALKGKYSLVKLNVRHSKMQLPEITVIDTIDARKRKIMYSHFSKVLIEKIKEKLEKSQQVILFQNRRGFSPYVQCKECGHIPKCSQCDVSLTYHKGPNTLNCHYCGLTTVNTGKCQVCESSGVETRGFGTEKIEDELKVFFPDKNILRMDLDTTKGKDGHSKIISLFENAKVDILIGTQMVSKGLDFNNVSLVGIMDADSILSIPDFRAFERAFQLMTQVSGRAGRSDIKGEVIIQSTNCGHKIINHVLNHDFINMFEEQIAEREQFIYPPFSNLIKITLRHKEKDLLDISSENLAVSLKKFFGKRVLGPEYPTISMIKNVYQKCILLKIEKNKSLVKAKGILVNEIEAIKNETNYKSLNISINVDPY